jgi:hypothetical protein
MVFNPYNPHDPIAGPYLPVAPRPISNDAINLANLFLQRPPTMPTPGSRYLAANPTRGTRRMAGGTVVNGQYIPQFGGYLGRAGANMSGQGAQGAIPPAPRPTQPRPDWKRALPY